MPLRPFLTVQTTWDLIAPSGLPWLRPLRTSFQLSVVRTSRSESECFGVFHMDYKGDLTRAPKNAQMPSAMMVPGLRVCGIFVGFAVFCDVLMILNRFDTFLKGVPQRLKIRFWTLQGAFLSGSKGDLARHPKIPGCRVQ